MSRQDRFEGLTVETAIAQIKKKPLEALDAVDFAFLRARESYLSAEDKATYLKKSSS